MQTHGTGKQLLENWANTDNDVYQWLLQFAGIGNLMVHRFDTWQELEDTLWHYSIGLKIEAGYTLPLNDNLIRHTNLGMAFPAYYNGKLVGYAVLCDWLPITAVLDSQIKLNGCK